MNLTYPFYKIEKPDLNSVRTDKISEKLKEETEKLGHMVSQANSPEYIYWDKFKRKSKVLDLTPEEGWLLVRQFRFFSMNQTFLRAEDGNPFRWVRLSGTDEYLHKIDMYAGGHLSASLSASRKNQLIVHGVIEEAIASSQLEGAHATRAQAKKMLLENRPPKNVGEQMILNNYRTIRAIEDESKASELSMDLMLELHRKLTEDTDLPKDEIGRLRTDEDPVRVEGPIGTNYFTTHIPPKEAFLNDELARLFRFANDEEGEGFLHPIIKAIFLHFWIGYLHPFTDGNGRLARALFYWYLIRKGYWTMVYIPISTIIKKSPAQYAMAYIYSEQDNSDLTYFYDFHMRKLVTALDEFKAYLDNKTIENKRLDEVLGRTLRLNERQKQVIHYLLGDEYSSVTITSHKEIHDISRQTAAMDLQDLADSGLVHPQREGQLIRFYSSEQLNSLKRELA